ncbi:HNH endonuclease [Kitasatospora sp. NPDC001175]|uniref:HNH endonuclease n=1 Tax=Kitasatospora sp. NPDC001175 TaxID=3157103 RepID=UPI003D07EFB8
MANICTERGCTKARRARGLCSTHYNQRHQPNRRAARPTSCAVCGARVLRPTSSTRRPTCSTTCRRTLAFGPDVQRRGGYDWASDAVQRAIRAGAVVVEKFDRLTIFERDNWTCYLYGNRVDADASPFDPASPTVDRVIPLSQGGEHSTANARTACLHYNSAKQAKPLVTKGDKCSGTPSH